MTNTDSHSQEEHIIAKWKAKYQELTNNRDNSIQKYNSMKNELEVDKMKVCLRCSLFILQWSIYVGFVFCTVYQYKMLSVTSCAVFTKVHKGSGVTQC